MEAKLKRSTEIYVNNSNKILAKLVEMDDGRVTLEVYDGGERKTGWICTYPQKILDLFVALFPDEVAYQFKNEDS